MNKNNNHFLLSQNFWSDHPWNILRHLIFGHPLKNSNQAKEKLGFFLGLPVLAIDALSSVAYATEEILIALSASGTVLYGCSLPIVVTIVILLCALTASYTQTVEAYPQGGGAYIISKNHLGVHASLIAAASLLIDYTLTVAVSVTAGIRALASSYPQLLNQSVSLSMFGICILAWINLRGLRNSAKAIAPFVYLFIVIMIVVGILGGYQNVIEPSSAYVTVKKTTKIPNLNILLDLAILPIILRAFAGGCTAMTGIEAIANAGSMLTDPPATVAKRILWALSSLLAIMFISITLIAYYLNLRPLNDESLLSQIIRHLWGDGIFHDFFQILTALVLFLAANTAFAGAPKLSAMLAQDEWVPKQLYHVGDRLVFSVGIIVLAFMASILVFTFQGKAHNLIPLYAIGVFSAFTLSQMGMIVYWYQIWRDQRFSWKPCLKMFINGLGAFLTAVALIVTFEAKFKEGAFLILIAVPVIVFLFKAIHAHYQKVSDHLRVDESCIQKCAYKAHHKTNRPVIVPISHLHRGSLDAISLACEISNDVHIILVDIDHQNTLKTRFEIEALHWNLKIFILSSPYRSVVSPIIEFVHKIDRDYQKSAVLILSEIVPMHWWQSILHNKSSQTIIKALAWSEKIKRQSRIIISVPYYVEKD